MTMPMGPSFWPSGMRISSCARGVGRQACWWLVGSHSKDKRAAHPCPHPHLQRDEDHGQREHQRLACVAVITRDERR